MREFVIALRIRTGNGSPSKWDWPDLIGEDVTVEEMVEPSRPGAWKLEPRET